MKRLLAEPLLHFVLLGAAMFVAYSLMAEGAREEPGKIVITRGHVEHLATGFEKTWQRPPSAEELARLVRERVREEVYSREARALSLDRDDSVIRRRLMQKMEFVADDIAEAEPAETALKDYLQAHPDAFRVEEQITFHQVYLDPKKHGENLDRDVAQVLASLSQAGSEIDASDLGDQFLLGYSFSAVPASEVVKQFGDGFTASLLRLKPGRWHGPIQSGYGVHLVRVSERTQGHTPPLDEVRDAVRREWDRARRLEANEKIYQDMLERYVVTIEGLDLKVSAGAEAETP